jgi:acyl carrier protein
VIATNLTAAFRLTRAALRPMLKARQGRIVNVASVVGPGRANPGQANYAAAKAGPRRADEDRRRRGRPPRRDRERGLPGLIETDMTDGVGEALLAAVPARRPGRPDEVAAAVAFLCGASAVLHHRNHAHRRRRLDRLIPTKEPSDMATTATPQQIEERVFEAVASFGPEPEDVKRDATFESLDVDSLDLVELGQIVQDEYGVELKSDDMPKLKTVGDAIDLIASRAS